MGNKAEKTEHAGPKKGRGAYYSRKKGAKRDSAIKRRQNDLKEIEEQQRDRDPARRRR